MFIYALDLFPILPDNIHFSLKLYKTINVPQKMNLILFWFSASHMCKGKLKLKDDEEEEEEERT